MLPWTYPARIERHHTDTGADTYLVSFPDIPEALTEGPSYEAAEHEAADALVVAVTQYLERGLPLPSPRPAGDDEVSIPLEPALAARAALISIMAEQGITKVALAARMGKDEKAVRLALRPRGASLDLVMLALRAVGARPVLSM